MTLLNKEYLMRKFSYGNKVFNRIRLKILVTTLFFLVSHVCWANPISDSINKPAAIQTTIIEIKNADKIFKQKEEDWWDKYSNAIIALFTVIGSAYISYKIASQQTKLGKEQLELTKKQMEENYRVAMAQVRANNISAARIEWIQKLRPLLAELITKTTEGGVLLDELKSFVVKSKKQQLNDREKDELKSKMNKTIHHIESMSSLYNQIKLYLNKDESNHNKLIEVAQAYIEDAANQLKNLELKPRYTEDDLIEVSWVVLKEAWEQAKNIN